MDAGTKTNMKWDAGLYDTKHDFVFKYGEDLVSLLDPKGGERILDVGCGTGYLTKIIADSGAEVIGIDNSPEMINKAKKEYPSIIFRVASVTNLEFDEPFDALFSNAVLHWVLDKEKAVQHMNAALKTNGRLVVEFGGKDNVKNIVDALKQILLKHGFRQNGELNPWYFPSLAEYAIILERYGFTIDYATYYKRDTKLKDTENGIKDWIKMFGSSFLKGISEVETDLILDEVQEALQKTNFRNNGWFADYKRLRIIATKV